MNRKGDISEGITLMVIVFFIAISFIVVALANTKISNAISDTVLNDSQAAEQILTSLDYITSTGINRGFVFIFAFLIIGMMLSSFLVRVHPAWLFLYILFLGFAIVITVPLANAYQAIIEADAFAEVAAQQTMITYVMQHSIKILIAASIFSWIILFAKPMEGSNRI